MELEGIAIVTTELDCEMEWGGLARLEVPTSSFLVPCISCLFVFVSEPNHPTDKKRFMPEALPRKPCIDECVLQSYLHQLNENSSCIFVFLALLLVENVWFGIGHGLLSLPYKKHTYTSVCC